MSQWCCSFSQLQDAATSPVSDLLSGDGAQAVSLLVHGRDLQSRDRAAHMHTLLPSAPPSCCERCSHHHRRAAQPCNVSSASLGNVDASDTR